MITLIKIIYEAIRQALQSMLGNKLRTFLSLLGITIGVFCIIAVQSAVDSLQNNIVDGFSELGSDVIYIDKMPWNEDPGQNYWKYAKRPDPSYKDFELMTTQVDAADKAAYTVFTGGKTIKHKSNNVSNAFVMGTTYDYQAIQGVEVEMGRYFTPMEYAGGANKVILGNVVAKELFGNFNAVGKYVKLFGQKYQVIGVLKSEGESMFNFINFDEVIWVGFNNLKRFVNVGKGNKQVGRMLNVKVKEGYTLAELKDEATGVLRMGRRLKPSEKDNFALNELSMLTEVLDKVFKVLNYAGYLIGLFALVVGMFSVANIMFVSVKERTNIIGVKKALGAKRNVILLEFLVEAVILCILGGLVGLLLVFGIMAAASAAGPLKMTLSIGNMLLGVGISVFVGVVSGVIPALLAANMDPVEAMRS